MSFFSDLNYALDGHLLDNLNGKYQIHWPNVTFVPDISKIYLKPLNIPGEVERRSLGMSGLSRYAGRYEIEVYSPKGRGNGELLNVVNDLELFYFSGSIITNNNVRCRIVTTNVDESLVTENGWFTLIFIADYVAFNH